MTDSTNKEDAGNFTKKIPSFSKRDILSISGIKNNPLSVVLIKKFTVNEKLDVKALVTSLNQFAQSDSLENKLYFLFEVYDSDGDGTISSSELFNLLKLLNKGILEDSKLQNVVDRTFAEVGEYVDAIDFKNFKKLILSRSKNLKSMFGCI